MILGSNLDLTSLTILCTRLRLEVCLCDHAETLCCKYMCHQMIKVPEPKMILRVISVIRSPHLVFSFVSVCVSLLYCICTNL
ncbi:hypothetical protein BDR03DRAFT_507583 [Suillus americanus]|nr:hypothetical protein BDR03DRAFT_507583 [Suillus americanus]